MFTYFEIIVTTFSNTSFFIYTIKLSFDRRIYNPIASLKQWVYGFEESGVNMTSIQVDILCFHRPTRVAILSFSILRPFNYPFNITTIMDNLCVYQFVRLDMSKVCLALLIE